MLFTLILTFFLDNVGLFMVVPIYAPLLLDPQSAMIAATTPYFFRTVIIGSLVASYGIGQLFGGPILGELSDQFGRKKILILGLICLVLGNALGAYSLGFSQLWLLFAARLLTGFASGNWSVIFAAITDAAPEETKRTIYLGYLTGAAALGAVLGPLVGAHVPDVFAVMAVVIVVNLALVIFYFRDAGVYHRRKLQLLSGIYNIFDCFKLPVINILLLAFFFFSVSSESIFAGLPIFVVEKFKENSGFIGNLIAVGSCISAFTSFYLNKKLSLRFSTEKILLMSLVVLCLAYVSFFIPAHANGLFICYGLFGLSVILVWTHANAVLTKRVAEDSRGKVLGVNQSLCSLAIIIGPFLIGLGAAAHYNLVIFLALGSSVVAVCLYGYVLGVKKDKPLG